MIMSKEQDGCSKIEMGVYTKLCAFSYQCSIDLRLIAPFLAILRFSSIGTDWLAWWSPWLPPAGAAPVETLCWWFPCDSKK